MEKVILKEVDRPWILWNIQDNFQGLLLFPLTNEIRYYESPSAISQDLMVLQYLSTFIASASLAKKDN